MGRRGPKPTPPQLHALRGDPSKIGRARLGAMLDQARQSTVEIPARPPWLSGAARAEWARIAPRLVELGLITQLDRAALAAYCTAWSDVVWADRRIRELEKQARAEGDKSGERGRICETPGGYHGYTVALQIRGRAMDLMAKFLAEFGMSPGSRTRVSASAQGELLERPRESGWAAP